MPELALSAWGPLAITLFTLRPGRTFADYREFSRRRIRPDLLSFPSVVGFVDLEVTGSLVGDDGWQLVEVMHITSPGEFVRDNDGPSGAVVAAEWMEWVAEHRVLFTRNLLPPAS